MVKILSLTFSIFNLYNLCLYLSFISSPFQTLNLKAEETSIDTRPDQTPPHHPNMSSSSSRSSATTDTKKYKGIRCRKWGKWVSEIRVPGTQDRLWLGSYSTPEGAAVAHDIAFFCLRGVPESSSSSSTTSSRDNYFNFPHLLSVASLKPDMSPRSVQKAASDAGMAIEAQLIIKRSSSPPSEANERDFNIHGVAEDSYGTWEGRSESREGEAVLNISVEDYL